MLEIKSLDPKKSERSFLNKMKTVKMMIFCTILASLLSACSANENHEKTTETHTPEATSYADHTADPGRNDMGDDIRDGADDLRDGAGNVIDDAGNIVEDAGDAVNDAGDSVGDAVKGQ